MVCYNTHTIIITIVGVAVIIILVDIIITFVLIIVITITIVAIVFITTSLAICNRQSARGEEDKLLPWVSHLPKVELCN